MFSASPDQKLNKIQRKTLGIVRNYLYTLFYLIREYLRVHIWSNHEKNLKKLIIVSSKKWYVQKVCYFITHINKLILFAIIFYISNFSAKNKLRSYKSHDWCS